MSIFDPGTGGTLKAVTLPSALLEVAVLLDQAENSRNGSNPSLTPKTNVAVTVDMGTRVTTIAATIPANFVTNTSGGISVGASDYLGATYSTFAPGTDGDLKSTNVVAAFVETVQLVASAEKAIVPADDQPNNVSVAFEQETSSITVTATIPITTSTDASGSLVIDAVDYLG